MNSVSKSLTAAVSLATAIGAVVLSVPAIAQVQTNSGATNPGVTNSGNAAAPLGSVITTTPNGTTIVTPGGTNNTVNSGTTPTGTTGGTTPGGTGGTSTTTGGTGAQTTGVTAPNRTTSPTFLTPAGGTVGR